MSAVTGRPQVLLNVARPWDEAGPVDVAQLVANAGLDGVGLADSPALFPDPLIATERVLTGTALSVAGPCVLSLGLRGPDVIVGALRTLAAHHDGRLVCFVGRGESSVRNAGLPIPSLKEHLATLTRLVELATSAGVEVPLTGAASGPRTIARTSAVLPGVLLDVGTDPGTVARAAAIAREANPGVRIWLFLRASVADTEEEMVSAAAPVLGSCATRLAASPDFYGLSGAEQELAAQVAGAHDYRRHGTQDATSSSLPPEAEALVRRRFLATGPATDVTATVAALSDLDLAGVVLAGALGGVLDRLPELATAVRDGLGTTACVGPDPTIRDGAGSTTDHDLPTPGGARDGA